MSSSTPPRPGSLAAILAAKRNAAAAAAAAPAAAPSASPSAGPAPLPSDPPPPYQEPSPPISPAPSARPPPAVHEATQAHIAAAPVPEATPYPAQTAAAAAIPEATPALAAPSEPVAPATEVAPAPAQEQPPAPAAPLAPQTMASAGRAMSLKALIGQASSSGATYGRGATPASPSPLSVTTGYTAPSTQTATTEPVPTPAPPAAPVTSLKDLLKSNNPSYGSYSSSSSSGPGPAGYATTSAAPLPQPVSSLKGLVKQSNGAPMYKSMSSGGPLKPASSANMFPHRHPLLLHTGEESGSWSCDLCGNGGGATKLRCEACNHDECVTCFHKSGSPLMNNEGKKLWKGKQGNRYCNTQNASYYNGCQHCKSKMRGRCGILEGCSCRKCHLVDKALGVAPYRHTDGVATPAAVAGSGDDDEGQSPESDIQNLILLLSFILVQGQMTDSFVRLPTTICTDCHCMEFPICSEHTYLQVRSRPNALPQCPDQACTRVALPPTRCRFCSADGSKVTTKMFQIAGREVLFLLQAIFKEKINPVPIIWLVCPDCRALECPGVRGILLNAFDILSNESAMTLFVKNLMSFKHRTGCKRQRPEMVLLNLSKGLCFELALAFIKTVEIAQSNSVVTASDLQYAQNEPLDGLLLRGSSGGSGISSSSFSGSPLASTNAVPAAPSVPMGPVRSAWSSPDIKQMLQQSQTVVVLFYNNAWCQLSKTFLPKFVDIGKEFASSVTFVAIDCFNNRLDSGRREDLLRDFEISGYPTTVVFRQTQELERQNGAGDKETLAIRACLMSYSSQVSQISVVAGQALLKVSGQERQHIVNIFWDGFKNMYPQLAFDVGRTWKVLHDPAMVKAFRDKQESLRRAGRPCEETLLFHGTPSDNVERICKENLSMKKKGANDKGWFGSGLYFSDACDYTMAYTNKPATPIGPNHRGKIVMFKVLLGKKHHLKNNENVVGKGRKTGYDSHVSPKNCEYIIFDNAQCLPVYVVEFTSKAALHSTLQNPHWEVPNSK
ncbi:Elongation factor 1-beta [Phlyctochytrium bullatum]|nr:Elongation factor 1-beta [Phlyctochytrium bullatum]